MKKQKKNFDVAQNFFSFHVVLRLRGKIVAPPILVQSKNFCCKIIIFGPNCQRNITNLKIEAKKISILCTFNRYFFPRSLAVLLN
jgi:hypothetical protein